MPDLLDGSHRACLAWATPDGPTVRPIEACFGDGHATVVVEPADRLGNGEREVVLLIDDGVWWFDLRAIYLRGMLQTGRPTNTVADRSRRWPLEPTTVVAWHYGQLREVDDATR